MPSRIRLRSRRPPERNLDYLQVRLHVLESESVYVYVRDRLRVLESEHGAVRALVVVADAVDMDARQDVAVETEAEARTGAAGIGTAAEFAGRRTILEREVERVQDVAIAR